MPKTWNAVTVNLSLTTPTSALTPTEQHQWESCPSQWNIHTHQKNIVLFFEINYICVTLAL